jgi:anti-anti-sigma regulatory factor
MGDSRKSGRRHTASASTTTATPAAPTDSDPAFAVQATALAVEAAPAGEARAQLLQLGPSLSIREVSECAVQFRALLAVGHTDIDARKLETIDTAGIQLLLAAAAAAQRRGYKLKLQGAQGLKDGAARSLGLNEHLGELAEIVP